MLASASAVFFFFLVDLLLSLFFFLFGETPARSFSVSFFLFLAFLFFLAPGERHESFSVFLLLESATENATKRETDNA